MKLLFICLGNICRSPAAEGVMQKKLAEAGLSDDVFCDSAGTSAYHQGEEADGRMQSHALKRGYPLTSISRGFDVDKDFTSFDMIFTMDDQNYENILLLDPQELYRSKVFKITSFCRELDHAEVPDPYYGGAEGFETVLDILEDACSHILEKIQAEIE